MASSTTSVNPPHPDGPIHQPQSTISVGNIQSIKLRGDKASNNYNPWSKHMLCLLESQDLLGYVNGKISPPDPFVRSLAESSGDTRANETNQETDKVYERADPPSDSISNPDYDVWRRSDRLVTAWILGSLEEEVMSSVVQLNTARDVWLELETEFTTPATETCSAPEDKIETCSAPEDEIAPKDENCSCPSSAGKDFNQYLELYRAIVKADWKTTETLLREDKEVAKAPINSSYETALHIAIMVKNADNFVTNLLEFMQNYSISCQDILGNTVLHNAATAGNTAVAKFLVSKNPDLLYIANKVGQYPVHLAADAAKKDTLIYLLSVTEEHAPYKGEVGHRLLRFFIFADFFDLASDLVNKYPELARLVDSENGSALKTISKSSAFRSGCNFNFWEGYIFDRIPVGRSTTYRHTMLNIKDIENSTNSNTRVQGGKGFSISLYHIYATWQSQIYSVIHKFFWKTMKKFVPQVNNIYHMKLKHQDAVRLVECLLNKIESLTEPETFDIYRFPMNVAASQGIHEVIELIVEKFPVAIYYHDTETHNYIFHTAVKNRCQDVYNLVYRMGAQKNYFVDICDNHDNSLLHMCATLAPPHKLNLVSGAALQMQRELQWFKEIENFVPPHTRENKNKDGKTPQVIFTEEHKKLKEDGEKWMRDTATSCIVAAALIATVVFAAAITVPGGNDEKSGFPKWSKDSAFIIFAITDAASLFTSTTSLLILLSLLTSRYAEEDFLYVLPKRLCVGLLTLFLSITFMMVAFSATLYLVFGQKRVWVLMPVAAMACLPIASFVLLQFPLLVAVTYSTYGPGIFGKKSNRPFY